MGRALAQENHIRVFQKQEPFKSNLGSRERLKMYFASTQ